MLQATISKTPI